MPVQKPLQKKRCVERGLAAITVYPTRVFGPGRMTDGNAATKAIDLYMRGRLPFILEGGEQITSWAYVEDVARGHVLALDWGTSGRQYILGGENVSLREVFTIVDALMAERHIRLNIPKALAVGIAVLEEMRAKVFRARPFMTKGWVESIRQSSAFSSALAIRELGYQHTSLPEGLRRTVDWLSDQKRI